MASASATPPPKRPEPAAGAAQATLRVPTCDRRTSRPPTASLHSDRSIDSLHRSPTDRGPGARRCPMFLFKRYQDPQLRDGPALPRRRVPRPARRGDALVLRPAGPRRASRSSRGATPWLVHEKLDLIVKSGVLKGRAMVVDLKDYQRGLVWVDGRFSHILPPGLYAYWTGPRDVPRRGRRRPQRRGSSTRTCRSSPARRRPTRCSTSARSAAATWACCSSTASTSRRCRRACTPSGRARPTSGSSRSTSARRRSTSPARRS